MKNRNMEIYDRLVARETSVAVVGVGYVGLPVLLEFQKHFAAAGYDSDPRRIDVLKKRYPGTVLSSEPDILDRASFVIITVATPLDNAMRPDLRQLIEATRTVGRHLKRGDYVVFESTVYPGCTDEVCIPLLEAESGLMAGPDFKVGYSPERINPGDPDHSFGNTAKIVSAIDAESLVGIERTYSAVISAPVVCATSITTAETAKIVENVQRNLNIALMNELQPLFAGLSVDTDEVVGLASSKWNFTACRPGLVGGHCIPVDPYYLVDRASRLGIDTPLIRCGCTVNESMADRIADTLSLAVKPGRQPARALIMGFSYKKNCDDTRNTRVADLYASLTARGIATDVTDPMADASTVAREFGINLLSAPQPPYDLIIVAVAHDAYLGLGDSYFASLACGPSSLLADIEGIYNGSIKSLHYWKL